MGSPNSKRIPNKEIIVLMKEALAAMEIKNFNKFRIAAYRNAIDILEGLTVSIFDLSQNRKLHEIPGMGAKIVNQLEELFKTGKVKEFEYAMDGLPEGMFPLIAIRGVGAKKAFKIADAFDLTDRKTAIKKTKSLAKKNKIQELEGFGEKSEKQILEAIEQTYLTKSAKQRILYSTAESIVNRIVKYMKEDPNVVTLEATGSFRRKNSTIGDLDIPVATKDEKATLEHFKNYPEIQKILTLGKKRGSVLLEGDVQVDLYVCKPEIYGSMVQYFTGSKQHNILLRQYALEKKLSLSEYGIKNNGEIEEFSKEKDFYKRLNLPLVPPELRTGGDEIEIAKKNNLPKLVRLKDLQGDFHIHTDFSDGINTFEEMAMAAIKKGHKYIGIADHAPSVHSRGYGTVLKIVSDFKKRVNKFNKEHPEIKVFFGYEVNILADATLGLPDEILQMLDFSIAGIHTAFNQNSRQITTRLVSALRNPNVNILAHPSGRVLNKRDPLVANWEHVFKMAKDLNKTLEINSMPDRLDLPADLIKTAKDKGVNLIINSDAHSTLQLDYLKYGINMARRGWVEKDDIINTLPLEKFVKKLGVR